MSKNSRERILPSRMKTGERRETEVGGVLKTGLLGTKGGKQGEVSGGQTEAGGRLGRGNGGEDGDLQRGERLPVAESGSAGDV